MAVKQGWHQIITDILETYSEPVSGPWLWGLDDGLQDRGSRVGGGATLLQLGGEKSYHLQREAPQSISYSKLLSTCCHGNEPCWSIYTCMLLPWQHRNLRRMIHLFNVKLHIKMILFHTLLLMWPSDASGSITWQYDIAHFSIYCTPHKDNSCIQ